MSNTIFTDREYELLLKYKNGEIVPTDTEEEEEVLQLLEKQLLDLSITEKGANEDNPFYETARLTAYGIKMLGYEEQLRQK